MCDSVCSFEGCEGVCGAGECAGPLCTAEQMG